MTATISLPLLLALAAISAVTGFAFGCAAMIHAFAHDPGPGQHSAPPPSPPAGPQPAGLPRAGRFPLIIDSHDARHGHYTGIGENTRWHPAVSTWPDLPDMLLSVYQAKADATEREIRELGYAAHEAFPEYIP